MSDFSSSTLSSVDSIYDIDEKIIKLIKLYNLNGNTNYFGEKMTNGQQCCSYVPINYLLLQQVMIAIFISFTCLQS